MNKRRSIKRIVFSVLLIVIISLILLFTIRFFSKKEIDDVSPGIPCEKEYLKKSDILYVIPYFNNKSISEDKYWCNYILEMNKTLAMHGVYHTYNEFITNRDLNYINIGKLEYEICFNKSPTSFKPPQLAISKDNIRLIKSDYNLKYYFNQLFHKVYHCNDTGKFSNKFMDWF